MIKRVTKTRIISLLQPNNLSALPPDQTQETQETLPPKTRKNRTLLQCQPFILPLYLFGGNFYRVLVPASISKAKAYPYLLPLSSDKALPQHQKALTCCQRTIPHSKPHSTASHIPPRYLEQKP